MSHPPTAPNRDSDRVAETDRCRATEGCDRPFAEVVVGFSGYIFDACRPCAVRVVDTVGPVA